MWGIPSIADLLNILGSAFEAGTPNKSQDYYNSQLELLEYLSMDSKIFKEAMDLEDLL